MYLVHSTTVSNFKKILEDGEIKSSSITGNERYDVLLDQVFMSVLFDNVKVLGRHDVLIFFPVDILKKYKISYWTPTWNYGEPLNSIPYNKSLSPEKNVKIWEKVFYKINILKKYKVFSRIGEGAQSNEVMFESKIPLSEAVFVFTTSRLKMSKIDKIIIRTTRKLNQILIGIS